jgi:twitching motility protein PilT
MALKELDFSDLILTESSTESWFIKGLPQFGQGLCPVDPELRPELTELLQAVQAAYEKADPSVSLRVTVGGLSFRVAVYTDVLSGKTFFLRRLADSIPDFLALGLRNQVANWLLKEEHSKGVVLFCGPQCSGKTTSAAAYIKARLSRYGGHCITFEHPVEMPLAGRHGESGYCWQSEIASETELPVHIERTHRYSSPNIVFIGEIRTKHAATEALRVALGSSKQLVVATIHGITLTAALDRLLTWAREIEGAVAQQNLAQTLAGVIFQELEFNENLQAQRLKSEFLLLPFDSSSGPTRAKLHDGNLFLDDDIFKQKNSIELDGML